MSISIYSTDQSTGVIYLITNLKNLKEKVHPQKIVNGLTTARISK